jgi:hypothetical protein
LGGTAVQLFDTVEFPSNTSSALSRTFQAGFYPFVRASKDREHLYIRVESSEVKIPVHHFYAPTENSQESQPTPVCVKKI